ncbi:MAG: hypothetical protein IIU74_07630, partial [Ruminiclostridium sp.]|nr:hypothetical protein [Ruminiclostridium sp.]
HRVKSAYDEYSRISTRLGRSAASVVDDLLRRNGKKVLTSRRGCAIISKQSRDSNMREWWNWQTR